MIETFDNLSSKSGFNSALRHFKFTTGLTRPIQTGQNIADLLNVSLKNLSIEKNQIPSILRALLVDKYEYAYQSRNAICNIDDPKEIVDCLSKWTNLQIVLSYYHPQIGICVINPSNVNSWKDVLPIRKDELLVVFVQSRSTKLSTEDLHQSCLDVHKVLAGEKVKDNNNYISASIKPITTGAADLGSQSSTAPVSNSGTGAVSKASGYRITPKYSVLVTNELFHNGNVEAWKRIIASYRNAYESLDVLVFYDGERINDLNALFKWGKVKHGTPILISVGGVEIKDVSKLRRYLFEGASPRFEAFLKGSIDQPLELF